MNESFVAERQIRINAPVDAVWRALTDPESVREYMHGTTMETDWTVGGPITWTGEWQGKAYQDKGEVLEVEPTTRLAHTHWSSMGGTEDLPENYHRVTYDLEDEGDETVLTLRQDNNSSQEEADKMAENNWRPVLAGIKDVAEARSSS